MVRLGVAKSAADGRSFKYRTGTPHIPRNSPSNTTVQAVDTAFAILDELRTRDEATLSELAEELGLAKSTVHRHLRTLHELDCVAHENNRFRLGMQLLALGEAARTTTSADTLIEQKVAELARMTGERAQFVVEEHGEGVCVFRSQRSKEEAHDFSRGRNPTVLSGNHER